MARRGRAGRDGRVAPRVQRGACGPPFRPGRGPAVHLPSGGRGDVPLDRRAVVRIRAGGPRARPGLPAKGACPGGSAGAEDGVRERSLVLCGRGLRCRRDAGGRRCREVLREPSHAPAGSGGRARHAEGRAASRGGHTAAGQRRFTFSSGFSSRERRRCPHTRGAGRKGERAVRPAAARTVGRRGRTPRAAGAFGPGAGVHSLGRRFRRGRARRVPRGFGEAGRRVPAGRFRRLARRVRKDDVRVAALSSCGVSRAVLQRRGLRGVGLAHGGGAWRRGRLLEHRAPSVPRGDVGDGPSCRGGRDAARVRGGGSGPEAMRPSGEAGRPAGRSMRHPTGRRGWRTCGPMEPAG